jgi:hypothetical protein
MRTEHAAAMDQLRTDVYADERVRQAEGNAVEAAADAAEAAEAIEAGELDAVDEPDAVDELDEGTDPPPSPMPNKPPAPAKEKTGWFDNYPAHKG